MKKTPKSPESTEVTPNKKKLKQARLPFMLISDVSPKTDSLPARKRKLSVPEAEPPTKVGKTSKENTISDDLVVLSDDDSSSAPAPNKEDVSSKLPNPYVKLVDTARKKKLQKNKGQKKSKSKSAKKLSNGATKQASQDNNDSMECDDVEMVEVDVQIHEDGDKNESEKLPNEHKKDKSESITTSSKKETSPAKQPQKQVSERSVEKDVSENKNMHNIGEIVCIDDSNNSSDVKIESKNSDYKDKESVEAQQSTSEEEAKSDSKETKDSPKKSLKKGKQRITPKRTSSRTKTKPEETTKTPEQKPASKTDSLMNKFVKKGTPKAEEKADSITNSENSQKDDKVDEVQEISDSSDIEMNESQNDELNSSKISETKEKQDETSSNKKEEGSKPATPKRSTRNKAKPEDPGLNMSTTSSKLDESMSSTPSTPKHNKSISETSLADKSLNESIQTANLTPKQLQKRLEANKKKEEREREKQERDKKRQQEKEERAKQKQEKEEMKKKEREEKEEARKKEKEEKEEQKRKEREEKEKQKELEKKLRDMKEEMKRKEKEDKEEQRRKEKEAREEEKRKRQEAMELEKQEQELKKKKAAEAFVNFFVPKQKVDKEPSTGPVSKSSLLSSFTIKVDMRLAPTTRTDLSDEKREVLDKYLEEQNGMEKMYLKCLKDGTAKPLSSGKTWPLDEKDDDVLIVEDELPPIADAGEVITCESAPREKLRPKMFSFHENRRPPYWGTWRKKSPFIKPRRPFGQDEKQLDYEVDSDDDWEDEQDGESLDGSAGGSEDEAADDYEVDNEVFVPHGYLSDEEATMDEEEDGRDVLSLSPETQKARLKHLEDEFESELKKPTEKLKPRLYGLLWENSDGGKPDNCVDALWNYFEKFAMVMNDPTALMQPAPEPEEGEKKKVKKKKVLAEGETNQQSPKSEKKKKAKPENKESKKAKPDKKTTPNQPGINSFLTKVKTT